MSSSAGRVVRIVAGVALVVTGVVGGGAWLGLGVVGCVPLLAGVLDVCLFAPFGAGFGGVLR